MKTNISVNLSCIYHMRYFSASVRVALELLKNKQTNTVEAELYKNYISYVTTFAYQVHVIHMHKINNSPSTIHAEFVY